MEKHVNYIWENVVRKYSPAKKIYIVGHSMGGNYVINLIRTFSKIDILFTINYF